MDHHGGDFALGEHLIRAQTGLGETDARTLHTQITGADVEQVVDLCRLAVSDVHIGQGKGRRVFPRQQGLVGNARIAQMI